jgi:hypothetical protein
MPQLQIFQASKLELELEEKLQAETTQPSRKTKISAAKRLTSPKAEVKAVIQTKPNSDPKPAPYGYCRVCGSLISVSGLDASLCSNPLRLCGSNGWVTDPQWLALQPQKGGKANG